MWLCRSKTLTLSCIMMKYDLTCFKNLAVFTLQDFISMVGHFLSFRKIPWIARSIVFVEPDLFQMFEKQFTEGVLQYNCSKKFVKFTGKRLWWSLFPLEFLVSKLCEKFSEIHRQLAFKSKPLI